MLRELEETAELKQLELKGLDVKLQKKTTAVTELTACFDNLSGQVLNQNKMLASASMAILPSHAGASSSASSSSMVRAAKGTTLNKEALDEAKMVLKKASVHEAESKLETVNHDIAK